ncbi:SulP family inorganic anion transporter [Cytophaga hutchinsonii]|uniref:Possible sulfate transporter n=1 Tax=Cytophaga hutchinsonii (strain ATCC 33406 / DSM 1761 / CIP 103989 / NBRC 15051 / NCIMB 9469 / D465) TaxID=269798 RepID=A0A6N4SW09_CYTH3|nr:SulP family inorganic anion transporter [Cytophaga hutchinsonii]ABG60803.1 possible sulfate transporter [Cytophaga hutchinsonii ATCC 33406]SFX72284.1 Sulfate permease, MFS superfamily [Cytophaga hutchinsonii ATCC 33406]
MIAQEELIFESEELESESKKGWTLSGILNPSATSAVLKTSLQKDLLAAFVVSLIALPLCMGIAIASGFPAVSGIYTALIGGLIITFISGTHVDIKGPASGLCIIILGAVHAFGENGQNPFPYVLACFFVAGIVQMIFALLRFGALGDSFPASAVLGMMASFGIMIAIKQFSVLIGAHPHGKTALSLLTEIPESVAHMHIPVAIIGIISLAIMIGMGFLKGAWTAYVPAPLVVIIVAVPLGLLFDIGALTNTETGVNEYLVSLPNNLFEGIMFPDFTQLISLTSLQYIIMIALAGSLESLLSSKAIEMADTKSRKSRLNKDLFAIGMGNSLLALIGGLPMISDAKRSLINVSYGAQSAWSNFFHAGFLLLIVVVGGPLIRLVPQAALAGILMYIAYKLASPKQLSAAYKIGPEQLIVFLTTMIICLFTNLLWGILAGIILELIIHMYFGVPLKSLFGTKADLKQDAEQNYTLHIYDAAVFSNYMGIKKYLLTLPEYSNVTFDFSEAKVVDHTFLEHLYYYEENIRKKGGQIVLAGLDHHKHLSDHPLASRRIVDSDMLTERQEQMQLFAAKNGYAFDHRIVSNLSKLEGFLETKHIQIKLQRNVLSGNYYSINFELSDLMLTHNAGGRSHSINMTNALFSIPGMNIPEFILEPDGFTDDFKDNSDFKDIDFTQHAVFSYYYLLKGPNQNAISDFFTASLIRFFEKNKGFRLESKHNMIFVYKKARRIKPENLTMLIDFTKALLYELYVQKNLSIRTP